MREQTRVEPKVVAAAERQMQAWAFSQQVAEQYNLSRPLLEFVDETTTHWASDVFGTWLDPSGVSHHKYVVHLGRIVLAAAREGNVVLVGRGAQFLLPREQGLAVRIVAPETYRVRQIITRRGLSAAKAKQFIAEVDRGRREFVRRFFHRNIDDPHLYDLVINVERFGPVGAAEQIIGAYPRP